MGNGSTVYVGLDVHKETLAVVYASVDSPANPVAPRAHRHPPVRHRHAQGRGGKLATASLSLTVSRIATTSSSGMRRVVRVLYR